MKPPEKAWGAQGLPGPPDPPLVTNTIDISNNVIILFTIVPSLVCHHPRSIKIDVLLHDRGNATLLW